MLFAKIDALEQELDYFRYAFDVGGGGGSDPPQTVTSTTTSTQELSAEQKKLLGLATPVAEEFVTNPPTLFPGSSIAGFDPLQQQAQQQILSAAESPAFLGTLQGATDAQQAFTGPLLQQSLQGNEQLLGQLTSPEANPFLQSAIQSAIAPLGRELTQRALPAVRSGAIEAGQLGGSRQGIAEGLATQGFFDRAGEVAAALANQSLLSGQELSQKLVSGGLDTSLRGLITAPQTAQLPFLPATITGAVGSQQRALEQAQLSEEAQKFLSAQFLPFAAAQDVAALAFGGGGGTTRSVSTTPVAQATSPSGFQSAIGGATLGGSLGSLTGNPLGTLLGAALGGGAGFLFG